MPLENDIQALTAAVAQLTAVMSQQASAPATATPSFTPPPQAAPTQMPTPPFNPGPPQTTPSAPPLPFNDSKGLVEYVTAAYYAMEAQRPGKGQGVSSVVTSMGVQEAGQITPDKFAAFYQMIETLKAQP